MSLPISVRSKRNRLRNQNVTSMFTQTTHTVAAPHGFACVVIGAYLTYPRRNYRPIFQVLYNRNPLSGFGARRVEIRAFTLLCSSIPINLPIGFYNSLYTVQAVIVTSRDCNITYGRLLLFTKLLVQHS